jgi:hypothetical protein
MKNTLSPPTVKSQKPLQVKVYSIRQGKEPLISHLAYMLSKFLKDAVYLCLHFLGF